MENIIRAVNNRVAINFENLQLSITNEDAIKILESIGFRILEIDIIAEARKLIEKSEYRRGAKVCEAPYEVDCSSLMKWLYGLMGIWIPRRSIQQREMGQIVEFGNHKAGNLIFCSGYIDYYLNNLNDGVGHVGIISDYDTVIHAANKKYGVIESSITKFTEDNKFRGIRRII